MKASRSSKITLKTKDGGLEEWRCERRALEPPNDTAVAGALFALGYVDNFKGVLPIE